MLDFWETTEKPCRLLCIVRCFRSMTAQRCSSNSCCFDVKGVSSYGSPHAQRDLKVCIFFFFFLKNFDYAIFVMQSKNPSNKKIRVTKAKPAKEEGTWKVVDQLSLSTCLSHFLLFKDLFFKHFTA